jgi:hypothetical protein
MRGGRRRRRVFAAPDTRGHLLARRSASPAGPSRRRTWWDQPCGKLPFGQPELAGGGPSTRQTNQAHLALD